MSVEYVQARFREYYPAAGEIKVNFDEDHEVWTVNVIRPFSDNSMMDSYPDQEWRFEVSSDDERFVFVRDPDSVFDWGPDIITIPFPPEPTLPIWNTDRFTDEEKDRMVISMMEEIEGSSKHIAHEQLDCEEEVELIMLADDDPGTTVDLLKAIIDCNAGMEDYESGEHEDHVRRAEFMRRQGLVDSVGDVTPLGLEFIERNS